MGERERRTDRVSAIIGGSIAFAAIVALVIWAVVSQTPAIAD
jgi:hypothetical protein